MPMGENVGRAYVAIYADGSSIPDDIRDELERSDPHVRAAGKRHGVAYDKAMSEQLKSGQIAKSLRTQLGKGIADGMKVDNFFASGDWTKIQAYIEKRWGENGRLAAASMVEEFKRRGSLDGIEVEVRQFNRRVEAMLIDSAKKIAANEEKVLRERTREMTEFERNHQRLLRETDTVVRRSASVQVDAAQDVQAAWDGVRRGYMGVYSEGRRLDTIFSRQQRTTTQAATGLRGFADALDESSDGMASLFGRGSRNNFLNFLGGFTTAIPRAVSGLLRMSAGIGEVAGELRTATSGLSGMAKFGAILRVIGPAAAGGALSIGALGISIAIMSSIASQAAGALTALVGTVGTGLVGAIGAVGGALVPLVAGIGVTVAAFTSLSDAQKEALSHDLTPLTEAFRGLGRIAANNIFEGLGDELATMAPVVRSLAPAIDAISVAIRGQITAWTDLVNDGAFSQFINLLRTDIPRQIESLGAVFRNLTTSITGLFAGLSPTVSAFLSDLDDLTSRFSKFVNSPRGENAVQSYFADAYDAARALGDAALATIQVVGSLFRAGAKFGGNDLFGDLADQFREWNDYLTDPANQAAIEQWVSDGADFARAIGDITVAIGEFIADLDTPLLRTSIVVTLETIAWSIRAIGDASRIATEATTGFLDSLGLMTALDIGFSNLGSTLGFVGDMFGQTDEKAKSAKNTLSDFGAGTVSGIGRMGDSIHRVAAELVGYAEVAGRAVIRNREQRESAREVARQFVGLGDSLDDAKVSLGEWIKQLNQQASALLAFGRNAKEAAKRGLDEGLIKSLNEAGPAGALRMRQLSNATDAEIAKANKAWQRGQDAIKKYTNMTVPPKKLTVETSQAMSEINRLEAEMQSIKDKTVSINLVYKRSGNIDIDGNGIPGDAAGRYYGSVGSSPRLRWVMEDGPEAIVPLDRPLSQVDPSVRALSAIAQGKAVPSSVAERGRSIDVGGITVVTPVEDPVLVAEQVVNRIAASIN